MMELLEDILLDSIKGNRDRLGNAELSYYAKDDCNVFISTLFHCLQELIEDYPKTSELYDVELFFDYIRYIRESFDEFDESNFKKKVTKIEKRIDYIIEQKIKNKKKLIKELTAFKEELEEFKSYITNRDNLETDFINYLLETPRNIKYIDMVFEKMPDVMKIKDERGSSLYSNIIERYFNSIDREDVDELSYYKNLLLLMNTKKEFKVSDKDKKKILTDIYNKVCGLSTDKKKIKDNTFKLKALEDLRTIIKPPVNKKNALNDIAKKYNIEINFKPTITDEVKTRKLELVKETTGRKIIKDYIVSIDGENSIEIDDALSCVKLKNGNYLLGVHIASILGYFDYSSPVVQTAFDRVHSIYLHNKKMGKENMIPIFPLEFSADFGSLLEGQDRLTRSYLFEIDKNGNVVKEEFVKSIINNNKQATYEEINNIIENGCEDKELEKTIINLNEVTKLLKKKYQTSEVYELIKESNDDSSDLKVNRMGSQDIVYRAMTLTGNRVANYFAENNYPCLYRVHSVPEKLNEKIESLVNSLVDNYGGDQKEKLYKLVTEIYPKSTYDIEGSHAGLKLDHYCHCTSGLRRSADIMVEHALEVCYDKTPTVEELSNLYIEIQEKKDIIKAKEDSLDWFVEDVNKSLRMKRF